MADIGLQPSNWGGVLAEKAKTTGWALCVGAGTSRPAFPDWRKLALRLMREDPIVKNAGALLKDLESDFSLDALIQASRDRLGDEDFSLRLSGRLYKDLKKELKSNWTLVLKAITARSPGQLPANEWEDFANLIEVHYPNLTAMQLAEIAHGSALARVGPSAIIRFIVQMVQPKLGDTIFDPACGTGGFLVESYELLKKQVKSKQDRETLQYHTLRGVEKKPMPYLLGMMNLLLHEIDRPNLSRSNALIRPLNEIGDKDRVNIIVTNPPFGGEEEKGIQLNFPEATRASETALLFLQLIMRSLKKGGRCGMVVPNGTLFGDGVCARLKEQLLKDFNLHTIVRLPLGVFAPYTGIPTNLLFFDRTGPTKEIWYYEQRIPEGRRQYNKTQPLRFEEFADCATWWKTRKEGNRAWRVPVERIIESGYNLDVKNPNAIEDFEHMPPEKLAADISRKEQRILEIVTEIKTALTK